MVSKYDPKRETFTINCSSRGVVIRDAYGNEGGNLVTHGKRTLTWTNVADVTECFLEFWPVLPPPNKRNKKRKISAERVWPFVANKSCPKPADKLLLLPRGSPVARVLKGYASAKYLQYRVLGPDGAPLLDPVIIIDPN